MKINVTINRYRIYKVLKWVFAGIAIILLFDLEIGTFPGVSTEPIAVVVYTILAIFFKLQEDSNKPTVEE